MNGLYIKSLAKTARWLGMVALLVLGAWDGDAQAVSICTSKATGLWSAAATWTCVGAPVITVPTAVDSVVLASPFIVTLGAAASITNVTVSTGATLSLATFPLTSTGNIGNSGIITATSTAGILASTGAAAIISGTNGTFSGSLRFYTSGAAPSIAAGSTLNFTGTSSFRAGLTAAGTVVPASALTINGTLNLTPTTAGTVMFRAYGTNNIISATGLINGPTAGLQVRAAATVTNNGIVTAQLITGSNATTSIWTNAANSTLNASTTLLATGVLNASAAGNTVNYNGAVAQTIKAPSVAGYGNLTLSGSLAKTTAANLLVNGNLTLSGAATFTAGTSLTHTIAGSFIINTTAATPFTWTTTSIFNFNTPAIPAATSIGGTTVATLAFNTVNINNTSGVNLSENASFSGILTVAAGATLIPSAASVVSGTGTLTGTGTVAVTTLAVGGFNAQYTNTTKTMTNLTVSYAGAGAQTVTVMTYGSATGGGLNINNASGASLTANTTVTGTLTLANGVVNAGAFTLITSANCPASVSRTGGWVNGNLQLNFPIGAPSCTFPVGDATAYRPIDTAFASVTVAGVLIGSQPGAVDHPNIASSGLLSTRDVNRYWRITKPTGSTIAYTTYSATFTFVAADYDAGAIPANFEAEASLGGGAAWTTTTIGARTATTNQATGIAVPAVVNTFYDFAVGEKKATNPGDFKPYDTTTAPAAALTGNLHTKIAGAAFTFDIAALNAAKTGLLTTFVGPVKVELLDSSDNSGALDPVTACRSTWTTVIQTLSNQTFNAAGDLAITGASGRHRVTPTITENNSWKDVRVRVSYPVVAPTSIACSTDRFAIRPNNLTIISVTDATWQTAGITRTLNNSGASGGNVHKAGQPFTISAAAYNAAGTPTITSNYAGSPTVGTLACTLPAVCTSGTLTPGAWSASGGTVTTTTASYSEAGAFNLTLEDRTFATVDSIDGTAADCTASGYYVCPSAAMPVGRFVPDHFDVATLITPTFKTFDAADAACNAGGVPPLRTFTYIGQLFGYLTAPQATVYARNAAGTTTVNYKGTGAGGLWKVAASDITQTYSNNAVGPALDTTLIGTPSVADNSNGTGTVTSAAAGKLAYQRSTAAPIVLFNANLSLTVSAQDMAENVVNQGIITSTTTALFNGTGTGIAFDSGNEFRYGRLKLSNAYGSELLNLPIMIQTQYWDATISAFVTNSSDNCTTLIPGNIKLTAPPAGVSATVGGAFLAGAGSLTLTKPTTPAKVVVDLCVDLGADPGVGTVCSATSAAMSYLQGLWAPGSSYNNDPTARATFGVYKGAKEFIYLRENY